MVSGPVTKTASAWVLGLMQIRVGECAANIATITAVLTAAQSLGALGQSKFLLNAEYFDQRSGFPLTRDGFIPLSESSQLDGGLKEITPYNFAIARGLDPTASVASSVQEGITSVTSTGTTTGNITVNDGGGWAVIDEEWTVIFTAATTGIIIGKNTGHVHDFANVDDAMAPDDGADDYFNIPASFFTGTWAADEIYTFHTRGGGDSTYDSAHSGNIGLGGLVAPVDVRIEGIYTYPNGTNTFTVIFPRAQITANVELDLAEEDPAVMPVSLVAQNASSDNTSGNAAWDNMPLGRVIWA